MLVAQQRQRRMPPLLASCIGYYDVGIDVGASLSSRPFAQQGLSGERSPYGVAIVVAHVEAGRTADAADCADHAEGADLA
jgi:hypothetical protein